MEKKRTLKDLSAEEFLKLLDEIWKAALEVSSQERWDDIDDWTEYLSEKFGITHPLSILAIHRKLADTWLFIKEKGIKPKEAKK
jgi:hypothetical protein